MKSFIGFSLLIRRQYIKVYISYNEKRGELMKKQTIFYGLSLAALAAGAYAVSKSDQKYNNHLTTIVKNTKHSAALKGFKYLGSWTTIPGQNSNPEVFHFGFNYLDQNGQHQSEEFWINTQTQRIMKHQLITL